MERHSLESEPQLSSSAEQFKNIQEVRLPSGTVEVADFTPENLKDRIPVYIGQGWGLKSNAYEPLMEKLCEGEEDTDGASSLNKRRAFSITHPSWANSMDSSMNVEELSKKYPDALLRNALDLLEVLEEKSIEQIDAVGHSKGALEIAIAASMYPEKFRSILFFNPAGMREDEHWGRLGAGFAAQSTRAESLKGSPADGEYEAIPEIPITKTEREVGAMAGKSWWQYLAKNPHRAISEIKGIKNEYGLVKDLIPYLHDLGINIAVISAESDPVFPYEETRRAAEIGAVDTFASVRGGHGMLGDHPEVTAPIVEAILEALAKKKKTSEQKEALANREYQTGVRYVPGEGLKISEYVKRGRNRE
jgi:pimeloyl-ACP methyl ester carboxylesterase